MLELRTLGTIELRGENGGRIDSVARHAKRISLLVHLCASHPVRVHRRATLAALLWPDLDDRHARCALRHELYALRRVVGAGVLVGGNGGGDTIAVDDQRIWCDAPAFETAIESGHLEEALRLYRGEFLPELCVGVHQCDNAFDEARARLSRLALEAARQLASAAEGAGDMTAAVSWARRLTELAPYDESGWQQLMLLLDRNGDRSAALLAYNSLAALLKLELEVEPSPETTALVKRIRGRTEALRTRPDNGASLRSAAAARSTSIGGVSRPRATEGDALNALLSSAPSAAPTETILHLRPAENQTGDPEFDAVGHRVEERLAQVLAEPMFVRLVTGGNESPTAIVSPTLFRRGDRIEVCTTLIEGGDRGRVLEVSPSVPISRAARDEALEAIAAHALAAVAARYDPRTVTSADGTRLFKIRSWRAYLHYIMGSELFGAHRFEEAATHFLEAYATDSTFVKAATFAGIALTLAGQHDRADSLAEVSEGRALSDYDRLFQAWALAVFRGRRNEAYRAARELARLTRHPLMVMISAWEAWNMGRPHEALLIGRSVPNLGSGWWRNWTYFWEMFAGALHVLGNHAGELGLIREAREQFPEALDLMRAEVRAQAALGNGDQVIALVELALTKAPAPALAFPYGWITPANVGWTAAQELERHGRCQAAERARALAIQWSSGREDCTSADTFLRSRLLLESGAPGAAERILRETPPSDDPELPAIAGLVCAARGDDAGARAAVAALDESKYPYSSGRNFLHSAGVRAALGDHASAVNALRRAFAAGMPFDVELHALPMLRPLAGRKDFEDILRPRD